MEKIFDIYEYNNNCRFILGNNVSHPLICVGINPSTATDIRVDPTIRQVLKVSQYNGYNGIIMLNLSPEISASPNNISDIFLEDYHRQNIEHIKHVFLKYRGNSVLACFGDNILIREYLIAMLANIYSLANNNKWFSLGNLTQKGNPRHPLFVNHKTTLQEFNMTYYVSNLISKIKN